MRSAGAADSSARCDQTPIGGKTVTADHLWPPGALNSVHSSIHGKTNCLLDQAALAWDEDPVQIWGGDLHVGPATQHVQTLFSVILFPNPIMRMLRMRISDLFHSFRQKCNKLNFRNVLFNYLNVKLNFYNSCFCILKKRLDFPKCLHLILK